MAIIVSQTGALRLLVKYVIRWTDGIFYCVRRVPADMKKHHQGKTTILQSLKTRVVAESMLFQKWSGR